MIDAADVRTTIAALRGARRRHYLRERDWVDSLYKAYVTVIVLGLVAFFASASLGGSELSARSIDHVVAVGPAWLGLAVAVAVTLGLRSGARGGPLALEAPDVSWLLLAPVPRTVVYRGAAWRQLRGVVFLPAVGGALAGNAAAAPLGGNTAAWIVAGALFGAAASVAAWSAALVASGLRWRRRVAVIVGAVLVAWSVVDVVVGTATSPAALIGRVAFLALDFSPLAIAGIVLTIGLAVVAFAVAGGVAPEPLLRRAGLVRELRYAATLQDLRSVIVLHRELAQELPRSRPWWHVRPHSHSNACRRRDWQGFARWPVPRFVRVLVFAVATGLALAGVWLVSDAFVVVAAIALFLAAVDAVEGLAQESDHPTRAAGYPVSWGRLVLEHLAAPGCVLLAGVAVGLAVFVAVVGTAAALTTAALVLVPAAVLAVFGAATSVTAGAPSPTLYLDFPFPEFGGLWLVVRQCLPPAIVATALVPVAVAHDAANDGNQSVAVAALSATLLPLAVAVIASRWLRSRREPIR